MPFFKRTSCSYRELTGFYQEFRQYAVFVHAVFRFCIPLLSHHFIGYSAAAIVSAAVIIANFSYQLVGDALKTVLSVDGEIKISICFTGISNMRGSWYFRKYVFIISPLLSIRSSSPF